MSDYTIDDELLLPAPLVSSFSSADLSSQHSTGDSAANSNLDDDSTTATADERDAPAGVPPPVPPRSSPSAAALADSVAQNAGDALDVRKSGKVFQLREAVAFDLPLPSRPGELYAFGRSDVGQCAVDPQSAALKGMAKKTVRQAQLRVLPLRPRIAKAACGFSHVLLLTAERTLLGFGNNAFGQCCAPSTVPYLWQPRRITEGELGEAAVADVACGTQFCGVVTEGGACFTWGYDGRNQLGRPGDAAVPRRVLKNLTECTIRAIDCGNDHSVILEASGKVLTFGRGTEGQLGFGEGFDYSLPRHVVGLHERIVQVGAGALFTVLLGESGQLYAFGDNSDGCMGNGTPNNSYTPTPVRGLEKQVVRSIACAWSHVMVITNDQQLYVWGSNRHGQLGFDDEETRRVPTPIGGALAGQAVVHAVGGMRHSVVVTGVGEVYTMGANGSFQCNSSSEACSAPRLVLHEKNVVRAACGAEHTLCFAADFRHYALANGLRSLVNSRKLSDVRFFAPLTRRVYHAHKFVLFARSSVYRRLLCQNSAVRQIEVEESVSHEAWQVFLEFLYTDGIASLDHHSELQRAGLLSQLYSLADKHELPRLEWLCRSGEASEEEESEELTRKSESCLWSDLEHVMRLNMDETHIATELTDVMFMVGDEVFKANKCVLYARCPSAWLQAMLGSASEASAEAYAGDGNGGDDEDEDDNDSEAEMDVVVVPKEVSASGFEIALRFIYTHRTNFDQSVVLEVLVAAGFFQMELLKQICETVIIEENDIELHAGNVAYMLQIAKKSKASTLIRYCHTLILENWQMMEDVGWLGLTEEDVEALHILKYGPEGKPVDEVQKKTLPAALNEMKDNLMEKFDRFKQFSMAKAAAGRTFLQQQDQQRGKK